uniref:Uncharacterized mitochondrial protein AtMg00810-like n=1 Tax=Tanacetum cinerariifolium TaxID=118510 RepID=A0A6L2M9W0_TANCI|nr:uncharacterized mitochondrial protein AtMg00810-like [Tanacetum cinerariifolium]
MSSVQTPQQNGVVERRNQTLLEAARTMLIFSRAPLFLWVKAIATACFTQNCFIIHHRFNKTPYELINNKKPDISFLYVFGALCYPKNDREDIRKLGAKADIDFFIGYSADSCAYRIYNRRTKKIMETMNVSFDELSAMAFEQRSSIPGLQSELDLLFEAMYDDYIGGQSSATARTISAAQEPKDVDELNPQQQHVQQQGFHALLQSKIVADNVSNAIFDGNTFVNPFAIPSTSAAESSSSHKNKHDEEQTVIRNKSHLAVRGYRQEEGIDFEESFAPGTIDPTFFIRCFYDDILVAHVYVDDIIFGSTHPRYIQLFSDLMKSRFEMSMMGEMTFFLGLQVKQSPCGIFINQSKYVLEILKKYEMESCDPVGTPMEIKDKLDLDQNETLVDATKYRSMIGALMYLTSSRSHIVHAICLCAWYQAKPTEKHLKEVKRIFCYLKGTVNTGLWYSKDSGFELTGFSDADYAGCKDTFKSTSGRA